MIIHRPLSAPPSILGWGTGRINSDLSDAHLMPLLDGFQVPKRRLGESAAPTRIQRDPIPHSLWGKRVRATKRKRSHTRTVTDQHGDRKPLSLCARDVDAAVSLQ